MKGTSEIEVLAIILVIVVTLVVGLNAIMIVQDIANALAIASSENVARNIGNFITLSSVAPGSITLMYSPSSQYTYDTSINDRTVNIKLALQNGQSCNYGFSKVVEVNNEVCSGSGKTAVGNLDVSASGNQFTFTKTLGTSNNFVYGVSVQ